MTCPSSCTTPNCQLSYRQHLLGIGISAKALPTRGRARTVARIDATEARWEKDGDAYKRLRRDGFQPPSVDGAHALERDARVGEHITMGRTDIQPAAYRAFEDTFGHSATEAA